jgi:hypothetical protein
MKGEEDDEYPATNPPSKLARAGQIAARAGQLTVRAFQFFLLAVKVIFDFEVGSTPSRIGRKQFFASFLGIYSGIALLAIARVIYNSLGEALWNFFSSLTGEKNILVSVVALIAVIPAILSLPLAWIIAGSSKETSTLLTLFVRALSFVILFCVLLVVVTRVLFRLL